MFTNDTLNIPPEAQRAHELELLRVLALRRRPVPLALLYGALVPRWASEAAERLLVRGELAGAVDAAVSVTEAGRATVAK